MPRATSGPTTHRRHKKMLKMAKGYWGARRRAYKLAQDTVLRGLKYAYRDRRVRKREFRALWIARINAAARLHGLSYSVLMHGLNWPRWSWIARRCRSWRYVTPRPLGRSLSSPNHSKRRCPHHERSARRLAARS